MSKTSQSNRDDRDARQARRARSSRADSSQQASTKSKLVLALVKRCQEESATILSKSLASRSPRNGVTVTSFKNESENKKVDDTQQSWREGGLQISGLTLSAGGSGNSIVVAPRCEVTAPISQRSFDSASAGPVGMELDGKDDE